MKHVVLAATLFVSALGCRETSSSASLNGKSFESVDELECGLGATGVVLCHWRIQFMESTFNWHYSDIGESGTYTLNAGVVVGVNGGNTTYNGVYDATAGTLQWDGVAYTEVDP
ncbi:MAG: hypothetical protein R3A47_05760 [Polyangiales bacterium]